MRSTRGVNRSETGRRTRRVLGVGLLSLSMLAMTACGSGDTAAPSAGDTVTIRFSWWGNTDRAKITNQAVKAFEAANPTIKVKTDSVDFNSYFDRLATSVAAGDEPDVITMGGAYPSEYAARGALLDLSTVSKQLDLSVLDKPAMSSRMAGHGTPSASQTSELAGQPAPEQTLMGQGHSAMKFAWSNMLPDFDKASGTSLIMLRAPGETSAKGPGMWLQASQLYTISARSKHAEAAAKLVSFLVSSPAAADIIGADRGIPANATLRKHLETKLDASEKVEYAYIDRISKLISGDFVIGPKGSTQTPIILTRLNDAVLFGKMKPAEAATRFVTEIKAAIS